MLLRALGLVALLTLTAPLAAAPRGPSRNPAALQKVLDCRGIADEKARLACFDGSVGELTAAQGRGDLAMVDREQVRETRRKLFGFTLPDLNLFGDGDKDDKVDKADRVEEITGKIKAVSMNRDGGYIITLEDGARWEQTSAMAWGRPPRPGATATIKRAALGAFKFSVDGSPSVKARRIG